MQRVASPGSAGASNNSMQLTISGYSTALYSTWYFIKEMRLLFDAGDGVVSALLGTSGRVKNIFLSHADRDHITGLLQFNQLNAKSGSPQLFYPKDARSIGIFEQFTKVFDRQVAATVWTGLADKEVVPLNEDLQVMAGRNGHVRGPTDVVKSLSYVVQQRRRKLKAEFLHLPATKIRELRRTLGEEAVTEVQLANIVGYSGDTPVEDLSRYEGCQVLIHEATFLYKHELGAPEERYNYHSTLDEVIAAAAGIRLGALVLGHFSSRYKAPEIDQAIFSICSQNHINFPVYRLLPGVYYENILANPDALIWLPGSDM